jgi:hypothetical protein
MPKGFFTQAVAILLTKPVRIDDLVPVLEGKRIVKRNPAGNHWTMGNESLLIEYRAGVNGYILADVIEQPWPDSMGDPQKDPQLFMAWSMGNFGPFAFPQNLERAMQHAWAWEPAATVPLKHTAFIRLRCSYILGAGENAPVLPEDYDSMEELMFLTSIAQKLLLLPEALCYFNPGGEIVRDARFVSDAMQFSAASEQKLPPLDLWSNIRLFNLQDGWTLMDTVGMGQLDTPDLEACFSGEDYDCSEVDQFLRNISLYLYQNGEIIKDEDTTDGPGGIHWRAMIFDESLIAPPRRVIRWLPDDRSEPLAAFGFTRKKR